MVRTRDLSFASDRVIGRALGREDNHDSDEALQRRRPTTFAHRQKEAVAEDVHHPQEAVVDAQGFPGGPHDTLVLTGYVDHVAVIVWNREERLELKLSSHGRKAQKFDKPAAEI
ncbi:hypothetical protein GmHk_06G016483 [Glycine max]|nr:hypothetical protein GmHk_06G016483 [Glycine max]